MSEVAYLGNILASPVGRFIAPDAADDIEVLLVTSSGELDIMACAAARAVVQASLPRPDTPIIFVSVGCVGLYAAILEFLQQGFQKARVLLLESPAEFVQETLDSANMGEGGDGFVAQDLSWTFTLSRQPSAGAWRVQYCAIFARPAAISGTASLATRVLQQLAVLRAGQPDAELVTFENCSEWSRRLAQLMDALRVKYQIPALADWLPTVENREHHYMTLRPLLDLQALQALAQQHPLILNCLGAGGRFGILLLCACEHQRASQFPIPAPQTLDLASDVTPLGQPRRILYIQKEYFGRDNFYFKWRLHREHL